MFHKAAMNRSYVFISGWWQTADATVCNPRLRRELYDGEDIRQGHGGRARPWVSAYFSWRDISLVLHMSRPRFMFGIDGMQPTRTESEVSSAT